MSGGLHYALIWESPRLQRILEILKEAEHPLSAQEIAVRAYDYAQSGKVMLNVSTNIGEMRGLRNLEAGYVVSEAHRFKPGPGRPAWYDGRPRYWLIAAPNWIPRWTIDSNENLVLHSAKQKPAITSQQQEISPPAQYCLSCKRPLPEGHTGPPFCPDTYQQCRNSFFGGKNVRP